MRFTTVLFKESHRWILKERWRVQGVYKPSAIRMPTFVRDALEKGEIKVQTGEEMMAPPKFPFWEPPIKDDPQMMPPKTIKDHVNYHEQWVYGCGPGTRMMEGEKQALVLTKSQAFHELPDAVTRLTDAIKLPDQDLLMQRIIMQSNVWDPMKTKLPRRINPQLPIWKFKAEWGITGLRIASTMVRNTVQLCEMACPEILVDRRVIFDPFLSTFYYFDEKHISIEAENDLLVCSQQPLPAFADEATIDASTGFKLPDLFPIAPTMDLEKQHVWDTVNNPGWKNGFSHPHTHTLFGICDDWWPATQCNAKALMYCFGQTSAQAKQLYGTDIKTLPRPISMQCVLTNGVKFSFTCFQLNTLDVESKKGGGVKNLVWFDADNAMYNKIIPKRAMLRNTKYEDYDPNVLRKIFALYAYGRNNLK